jgi:hypothetical protein
MVVMVTLLVAGWSSRLHARSLALLDGAEPGGGRASPTPFRHAPYE